MKIGGRFWVYCENCVMSLKGSNKIMRNPKINLNGGVLVSSLSLCGKCLGYF